MKLQQKGIEYLENQDVTKLIEQGWYSVPMLELEDGELLEFNKAVDHINNIGQGVI